MWERVAPEAGQPEHLLFARDVADAAEPVAFVGWARADAGHPCLDVAACVLAVRAADARAGGAARLLERYYDALEAAGVSDYAADEFFDDARLAVALLFVGRALAALGGERGVGAPPGEAAARDAEPAPGDAARTAAVLLMEELECAELFRELGPSLGPPLAGD